MLRTWFTVGTLSLTVCLLAPAQTKSDPVVSGSALVIDIDGKTMSVADVERKHPTALFQARNAYYQAQQKAAEEFIDEYLLETQAAKENVTVAQLLQLHVDQTIAKDPSEESLRVYYEGVDTKEPYDAVRGQILDHLREIRKQKAKSAYMESLHKQYKVALRAAPPRMPVALENTPVRGSAEAPLVLVEYADFECAYCQQIQPTLEKLEATFKDKLKFAYKDFPLPMHPRAQKAAEAAHCAGAQGQYWTYHDLLFSSKQLEIPQLKQQARDLKLNGAAFDQCLDSGAEADVVKTNLSEAESLGVQGTPSFLINGRFFSGNLSFEAFRAIIDEELGAVASRAASPAR